MGMVRRNFRRLDEEDFLLIYKTYIRNRIRYCVQAWSCTALEERVLGKGAKVSNKDGTQTLSLAL